MKIQEIKEQFGNCPTERLPELIEAYKEDERSGTGKLKLVNENHDLIVQGKRMGICFG